MANPTVTIVPDPRLPMMALQPNTAALMLGVSRRTITRLLASGALKARKLGRHTLIEVSSLEAYFDSLPPYEPGAVVVGRQS